MGTDLLKKMTPEERVRGLTVAERLTRPNLEDLRALDAKAKKVQQNSLRASLNRPKAAAIQKKQSARDAKITMWTCDYSYDYIRINADYRT